MSVSLNVFMFVVNYKLKYIINLLFNLINDSYNNKILFLIQSNQIK